ncbi:MAG: hypothetical protein AAGJ80_15150, partial [Cyanobacteria bacterium J06553_1]
YLCRLSAEIKLLLSFLSFIFYLVELVRFHFFGQKFSTCSTAVEKNNNLTINFYSWSKKWD